MPSPSEQLSQRAYTEAQQGVVKAVSDNLRARRGMLIAGGFVSSPPEPNWDALANEAINSRSINGIALSEFPRAEDGRTIDSMIPTPQRMELIARDVSEGVADNTGSMEMLQGATIGQAFRGFFSMISERGFGAALSGVFNLLFGDGNSDDAKALKGYIATNTATAVSDGVTSRLRAHAAENGLTEEQIQQIGAQTQNSVRGQAGLPLIPVPGQPPAGSGPADNGLSVGDSNAVRAAIQGQVLNSLGLQQQPNGVVVNPSNAEGIARLNKMAAAAGAPGGQFSDAQRNAITETMTNALHSVATANPPVRDPNTIRDQIKTHLAANADAMGFGGMQPTERDAMVQLMANQMTANYLKARPIDRAAGAAFELATQAENTALEQTLMRGRIRPAVLQGLGLQENPPGTFVNASVAPGTTPKIQTLEMVAGRPLTNEQRGAVVGTMSDALTHAASTNMTDPNAIRDEIKRRLEARATEMGFGGLSPDDRNRLFTVMANESTANYLSSAVSPEAGQAFAAAKQGETARMTGELASARVRQGMFDALAEPTLRGVEDNIIDKIREQRRALDTAPKPEPLNTQLKTRMDSLLSNTNTPEGRAQILSFATAMGGPNQAQREAMARSTSEAMVGVLTAPENRGKSREELAPLMDAAVTARLRADRDAIQNINPRFRLTEEIVTGAGTAASNGTRTMTDAQFTQITDAQRLLPAGPVAATPLNFNITRASEYARTMPAVVDRNAIREDIRARTRASVVQEINNRREAGVRDSYVFSTVQGAIDAGYAPNDYQRDRIADIVADTTANVMTDPNVPANERVTRIRSEVTRRLNEEKDSLNRSIKDDGYANNPMNRVTFAFYKWSIDNDTINSIASATATESARQINANGGLDSLRQLDALMGPITVEAPRVPTATGPAPGTPGR